ncbi:hypothetical protein GN956_G3832 [Arapaima gigas]
MSKWQLVPFTCNNGEYSVSWFHSFPSIQRQETTGGILHSSTPNSPLAASPDAPADLVMFPQLLMELSTLPEMKCVEILNDGAEFGIDRIPWQMHRDRPLQTKPRESVGDRPKEEHDYPRP